jgi:glycosylphosphatidylinositol deacylase
MMHQRLSKWPQISACKFIISAAIASFLLMALFKVYQLCFVFEHECEMTYMYMKPQYIEVDLPNDIQAKYPQYELFVYGEGSYAADLKRGVLKGVPALYIPGNGGSYKQARSPASVALLMRPKEFQSRRIFNFFTVSFNEELSGLYGGVLQRQVEFVAVCVKHILSLYKHMNNPPSTIPLLGHSMGGVVARALFSLPSFPVESVHLIITLSSPHTRPILPLDTLMEDFYHSVDEVWQGSMTSHVTLVSFSSGPNDFQVLSPTTHVSSPNTINIPSTGVPRVWASTDHHEILWCRRLELALLRSLFQLQNGTAHELVKDPSIVRRTFCQHFMNPCSEFHPSLVPFPSRQLYPINTTTYVSGGHTSHGLARYLSFNLSQSAQWLVLSNVISLSSTKWLLGCNFTGKQCVDLSPWTASLPPIYYSKNKMMVVDTRQRSLQQLIVLEPPLDHKSHLIIEPYYRRQEVTLKLPVLSAEYDLSSKNHLILLPMDTAHDFVFVQLFEVQVLCAGLDTPSLDFIIAGFYPHGRLKSANLTSLHGSDVFQGKLQLSWQPESLNQSLLILLPSLQCKAKVLVSLDVEETVLQLTLHTVVLILKAVCSLLLLQVLWPAPSTTLSVWGLGLTISLLVCFSISYFGFNPTYIAVHCGVVLLYDLLTLVVSVGWHWINKICCKTLFRCNNVKWSHSMFVLWISMLVCSQLAHILFFVLYLTFDISKST